MPKELQDKMAAIGIVATGRGKYVLDKQVLNVRVYKDHLVVRVGGGWDTLVGHNPNCHCICVLLLCIRSRSCEDGCFIFERVNVRK